MRQRDNRGYSLVEIIIVVAIIAIMTGGATAVFFNWQNRNINDTVRKIDTALSATKVEGTSKTIASMSITKHSNGIYYLTISGTDTAPEEKALGDKHVVISYKIGSESLKDLGEGQTLTIEYDRASGGFAQTADPADSSKVGPCNEIVITRASKKATITLVSVTGKHSVKWE